MVVWQWVPTFKEAVPPPPPRPAGLPSCSSIMGAAPYSRSTTWGVLGGCPLHSPSNQSFFVSVSTWKRYRPRLRSLPGDSSINGFLRPGRDLVVSLPLCALRLWPELCMESKGPYPLDDPIYDHVDYIFDRSPGGLRHYMFDMNRHYICP